MDKLTLRFTTFDANSDSSLGIESGGRILDLAAALRILRAGGAYKAMSDLPLDLLGVIKEGDAAVRRVQEILDIINEGADVTGAWLGKGSYTLLAPIPRPEQNVLCLGLNYASHLAESEDVLGMSIRGRMDHSSGAPRPPLTMFSKRVNTVIGHGAEIPLHAGITQQVDYEAELAFVLGRGGINIRENEADSYVFGYTIINEVSARDLQVHHKQAFKGKSLDGYCPTGPVLVHRSAMLKTPRDGLSLKSYVNGELRHDTSTSELLYGIPEAISILSAGMTLYAGEIVATGNPKGSGISFDPPRFMQPGDRVDVEIEGIGTLSNRVALA